MTITILTAGALKDGLACAADEFMKAGGGTVTPSFTHGSDIRYAGQSEESYGEVRDRIRGLRGELRTLELQTSVPLFKSPDDFGDMVEKLLVDS